MRRARDIARQHGPATLHHSVAAHVKTFARGCAGETMPAEIRLPGHLATHKRSGKVGRIRQRHRLHPPRQHSPLPQTQMLRGIAVDNIPTRTLDAPVDNIQMSPRRAKDDLINL